MKRLQESIEEYEEQKRQDQNKLHDAVKQREHVKNERAEKRQDFLAKDRETDAEKEEMGKAILDRFSILSSDKVFMKGLGIANSSRRNRKIFETPVKDEGEYLDYIRERLGHFKRQVTHVFACNRNDLVYYQYWTPTQWAEAMSCHSSRSNESDAILLRKPSDFRLLSYSAVSALHQSMQTNGLIDRLSARIASKKVWT